MASFCVLLAGSDVNYPQTNLEVVTERPVTQHLEESMMIRVFPDIIEIWQNR